MRIEKTYYWPGWLADSSGGKNKFKTQKKLFGQIQIYLWRALNIYDDFLDGEGQPEKLPLANRYFRNFLTAIYNLKLPVYFYKWAETKLFDLEKANQEEAKNKKIKINQGLINLPKNLPKFNNLVKLSNKSLALSIAPIALLIKTGLIKNKINLKKFNNLFKYALAAKQLADDAYDWLEDLKAGRITAVNVLILSAAKNKKLKINLKKKPELAYLLFAEAAAEKTCYYILNLCAQARNEAEQINMDNTAPIITKLINPLEQAAQKALNFKKML